jgi:hypothetical protein
MPASTNEIHLDFANNEALAAIFAHKAPGDKCTVEITLQIKEINEKRAIGSIEKVVSDYEDEEKSAKPSPEAPMMIEMKPMMKNG